MYQPASRVLTVLELLQSRPGISGPQLAACLEVDVRTVRRYITTLQDLGIPVEAGSGRYGGYRLRPGFKLPPLMFNEEEALALTLGLLAARRLGVAATGAAVEGALAKIERVLPANLREQVQAHQQVLNLDLLPPDFSVNPAILNLCSLAVQQKRRVCLTYQVQSPKEEPEQRPVDLYGVVNQAGRWYGVGYCHLRQALRVFRLDRVTELTLTETSFTAPPEFDAREYLLHSIAGIPDRWEVLVWLDLPLAEARRRVDAGLALLQPQAGGTLLQIAFNDLDKLARYLVGLDCKFRVEQPPELKTALRCLAAEIQSQNAE